MSNVTLGAITSAYMPNALSAEGAGKSKGMSFTEVLSNAVHEVEKLHNAAATEVSNLVEGRGGDLNSVMIAVEKADVSFQLMMQVRNKIVGAYQDIEKMQF